MTSAPKRRPANLTRQLRHSTHMVLARYSNIPEAIRARSRANGDSRQLIWKSIGVVFLCAACVFSFFLVSNRHLFRRDAGPGLDGQTQRQHPQIEPVGPPAPKQAAAPANSGPYPTLTADGMEDDAKEVAPHATTTPANPESLAALPANESLATVSAPGPTDRKAVSFVLAKTAGFQNLDGVQLKLLRVDNQRGWYDLAMRKSGREFRRSHLRPNQQVVMKRTRLHLPEVVVNSIDSNHISGYLVEASQTREAVHLSRVSHHRRHNHSRRRQRA